MSSYAPDGGLWVPNHLPRLSLEELGRLQGEPFHVVVATIIAKFSQDEVPFDVLLSMAKEAYDQEAWGGKSDILPIHPLRTHSGATMLPPSPPPPPPPISPPLSSPSP